MMIMMIKGMTEKMIIWCGQLANIANNLHFMGLEFVDHYMARFYFETSQ